MKKLFTLLTLALMSIGSAWAQTIVFDAADAGWSADGVDLTSGTTTVGDATWNGGGGAAIATGSATVEGVEWSARLKFGGKSTFKSGKTLARVLTFTPSAAGTVRVYGTHGSSSGTRTFYISQSITSTDRDVTTALGSFSCTPENKSGVAIANVEKDKIVYIWSDDNIGVYGVTFEASNVPSISATNASITATTSGVEVTQDIDVTGSNLTGSTLTATLSPAVAGLSVTLASSTITAGAISTTATLHYTQTVNAKGSTTLTLSDGTTSKDVTVNYKALVVPTELRALTDATTFDLTKVESGLGTVTPDDYVVLTDAGSEVDFADQLAVKGINGINVTWRGNAVQAGFFKFKTTVPGTVTVKFSDTGGTAGGDRAPRYANVNGTRSDVSSNGASGDGAQVTCSPIAVSAGEVIVKGEQYNSGGDNYTDNQFRVFEIVFTPLPAGNDVVEIGQYEWATLVSANDLDFTGSAVQAYIVTDHSGSYITTTQVNKVAAGTPVLLNAANGSYIIPTSFAGSADATTGNLLVAGTDAAVDAGSGVTRYVLSTDGSKAVFKKINATAATVAAGKAYLEFTGDVPAPMLSMGGETTGVADVRSKMEDGRGDYYNLAGQRVNQPTKGLYIVNGKKVVIK